MVKQRFVLAAMMFLIVVSLYAHRLSFPLILTQMVYIPNSDVNQNNAINFNGELICPMEYSILQNKTSDLIIETSGRSERFQWSQKLQGQILSSFYMGNILSQIPGGILAQKYGAKIVLLVSTFSSAFFVSLIPLAVSYGDAYGLMAAQIVIGFLQGPLLPCIASFLIPWFPIEERGRNTCFVYVGINTGAFISSYLAGLVIHHTGRWDVVFYGLSVIIAIFSVLFAFLCYNNPQDHPFISDEEKEFLQSKTEKYLETEKKNVPPTPWKAILTSKPVIALLLTVGFFNCSGYMISVGFPKYLNDVLHISIEKNSIYSSVPRFINVVIAIVSGFVTDWMHANTSISLTTSRKIFCALASIISAIFALAASYGGCDEILVVTLLAIAISAQGFDASGTILNGFDLGPNYIGPLKAVIYTIYAAAAFLAPYIVGILTPNAYLSEWRIVFWVIFVLYISNSVIFTLWSSAKIQPWNSPQKAIPYCGKDLKPIELHRCYYICSQTNIISTAFRFHENTDRVTNFHRRNFIASD